MIGMDARKAFDSVDHNPCKVSDMNTLVDSL